MAKKTKEPLVVQSKVKTLVKKAKLNCASDVMSALTVVIEDHLSEGYKRCKANGRKTLRACDL